MAITLTPQLEQRIQQESELSGYDSPDAFLDHVLDIYHQRDANLLSDLEEIRAHIEEGWQQAQRGEVISAEHMKELLAQQRAEFSG